MTDSATTQPTSTPDMRVYRARMVVSPDDIDLFLDAMSVLEPPPGAWEDVDSGDAWIEAFSTDKTEIAELARAMADVAESLDGKIHAAEITELDGEDWTEKWKQFFHVLHITERITVRPVWEEYAAAPGEIVIDIEPGMSFGTGIHPTTQSCIRFIERVAESGNFSRSLVDMGCGSGILAIAARKLGFAQVAGYDNDPSAVRIARENAATNGLDDIPFAEGDALAPELPGGDIVVANILAPVLLAAASALCRSVSPTPDGVLILSGILDTQYPEIKAAYEAEGFEETASILAGEWRSGMFRRR